MSEYKIPDCEVKFHPHSFGDHRMRLFRWNGEFYRGISAEGVPFFTKLFQDGVIQRLTKQGLLIDSEVTHLGIDGYEMVVRHRAICFTSYPNEWCAAMLKDAALTLIELAIELAQRGFTLGDGHPWNLLFDVDTCKPVFVDLGSILPIYESTWAAYDEFCLFCLYPLILMSHEQHQFARLLMCEDRGVLKSDILMLTPGSELSSSSPKLSLVNQLESVLRQRLPHSYRQQVKKTLNSIKLLWRKESGELESHHLDFLENFKQKSHLIFLKNLKQKIESITLPDYKTEISESYKQSILGFSPQDTWTVKQQTLHKILTELQAASVLDLGSGTGWYSLLAAVLGSKVVAFDTDEACITQLYNQACENNLPILPLVMDFSKPTPSRGLSKHWAIAATKRLKCDLVLALALVHHIVLERRLNFDQIVKGLAQFSRRWVVVEFIPPDDPEVVKGWSERVSWYTLDNFINALKKRFRSVTTMPSHPDRRVLLLCEK